MRAPTFGERSAPLLIGALAGFGLSASLNHGVALALIATGATSPEAALFGGRPPGLGTEFTATVLFLTGLVGTVLAFPVRSRTLLLAAAPLLLLAVMGPAAALQAAELATGRATAVGPDRATALALWGSGVGALLVLAARAVRARGVPVPGR